MIPGFGRSEAVIIYQDIYILYVADFSLPCQNCWRVNQVADSGFSCHVPVLKDRVPLDTIHKDP